MDYQTLYQAIKKGVTVTNYIISSYMLHGLVAPVHPYSMKTVACVITGADQYWFGFWTSESWVKL